jgi:hypothetical protein
MAPPASAPLRTQAASPLDPRYCAALGEFYLRLVGKSETELRGIRRNDAAADEALEECRRGDAAAAVPVLEPKVTDNRITLPARE